jgi:hypothetical protein
MKHYAGDMEAQMSSYEWSINDRELTKKFKSHDIRDKWGLSFKGGTLIYFFNSRERMLEKKEFYENTYGTSKVIKPKHEILRTKKRKLSHSEP